MNRFTDFYNRLEEVGDGVLAQVLQLICFVAVYLVLCVICYYAFRLRNIFEVGFAGLFAFIALGFAAGIVSLIVQGMRFIASLKRQPRTIEDDIADMCIVPLPNVHSVSVSRPRNTNIIAFPGRTDRQQTIEED